MTTAIVIDASAAVEIVARTSIGTELEHLLPRQAVPWIPDGLFDAEVMSVLRRWELRATLTPSQVAAAMNRVINWRLRRAAVSSLTAEAWTMRHNVTFTDACYVSLAQRIDAPCAHQRPTPRRDPEPAGSNPASRLTARRPILAQHKNF